MGRWVALLPLQLLWVCGLSGGQQLLDNPKCNVRYEPGTCRDFAVAWYYDRFAHRCREFFYSGCGGNENRFSSKEACDAECRAPVDVEDDVERRCLQPHDVGTCAADIERWYFDWTLKRCVCSWWSGCGGNSNRYYSSVHCMEICGRFAQAEPLYIQPDWIPPRPLYKNEVWAPRSTSSPQLPSYLQPTQPVQPAPPYYYDQPTQPPPEPDATQLYHISVDYQQYSQELPRGYDPYFTGKFDQPLEYDDSIDAENILRGNFVVPPPNHPEPATRAKDTDNRFDSVPYAPEYDYVVRKKPILRGIVRANGERRLPPKTQNISVQDIQQSPDSVSAIPYPPPNFKIAKHAKQPAKEPVIAKVDAIGELKIQGPPLASQVDASKVRLAPVNSPVAEITDVGLEDIAITANDIKIPEQDDFYFDEYYVELDELEGPVNPAGSVIVLNSELEKSELPTTAAHWTRDPRVYHAAVPPHLASTRTPLSVQLRLKNAGPSSPSTPAPTFSGRRGEEVPKAPAHYLISGPSTTTESTTLLSPSQPSTTTTTSGTAPSSTATTTTPTPPSSPESPKARNRIPFRAPVPKPPKNQIDQWSWIRDARRPASKKPPHSSANESS